MASELISEFVDLTALGVQREAVLKAFNEMQSGIDKMNSSVRAIGGSSSLAQTKQAAQQAAQGIQQLNTAEQQLADNMREYEKLNKQVMQTQTKFNVSQSEAAKQLAATKEQLRQANQELKNQVREQQAAEGSIEQMRAALIRITKEYDRLSQTERDAASGQELKVKVDSLSSSLKKLEGETGRFQRNVGNYSGAVSVLQSALREVKEKLDGIDKAGGANADVVAQLEKEYLLLSQVTESAGNGFISMREEIKKNQVAIEQLTLVLGEESPVVQKLIQENGELRDSYSDLVATQKTLGSDTFTFDALLQGGQALTGMYSAAEGAAALFGEENEDLQKTFVKLQAAMALVQGVQATVNALQKEGALVQGILAARTYVGALAQRAFAFATAGATAAAKAFNTALLAGGITAVLVLLPLVVQGMQQFTSGTDDAADSQDDLQKELEETKSALSDLGDQYEQYNKTIDRQTKAAVLSAKERGASEAEIIGIEQAGLVKRKQQLQDQKEILDERYKNDSLSAEELKSINENRVAVQGEIEDLDLEIREKGLDRVKSINEERKKAAQKAAEESKDYKERELKAQFELIKYNKEQEIAYLKAQSETDGNPYKFRTEALMDALEAEEQLIMAQMKFNLSNEKVTATERVLIEQKANDEIIAKRTEYAAAIIALNKSMTEKQKEDIKALQDATDAQIENEQGKQVAKMESNLNTEISFIQNAANRRLKTLNEEYAQGEMSKEEYEKRKSEIENEALRKSLQAQIDYYKKLAELYFTDEQTREDALAKIAAIEKQLTDITVSEVDKRKEKKKKETEEIKDAYVRLAGELRGLAFDLFAGDIDKKKNAIQEEIDALDEKKAKEIEVAAQSSANEQEKADKIAVINAKAQADKERLERKQRQLDEQKARFERARAITEVIQNTAVAVMGYLKDQNYPMAILTGIIGAAQIARIVAQPIPKYKDGKTKSNKYEGLAWVGDGGKQEAIIREGGQVEITPNKDTLAWIGRNDIVLPDATQLAMQFAMNKTSTIAAKAGSMKQPNDIFQAQMITGTLNKGFGSVVRAVKESKPTIIQKGVNRDLLMKFGSQGTNYV